MQTRVNLVLHINTAPLKRGLSQAVHRLKTLEIREILMEGHAERELLTTASTGNYTAS